MLTKILKALNDSLAPLATDGWTLHVNPGIDTPLPYMVIGYISRGSGGGSKLAKGGYFIIDVNLWSDPNSEKVLTDKMDAVISTLFNITGTNLCFSSVTVESTPIMVEDDAFHGVVRMGMKIKEV